MKKLKNATKRGLALCIALMMCVSTQLSAFAEEGSGNPAAGDISIGAPADPTEGNPPAGENSSTDGNSTGNEENSLPDNDEETPSDEEIPSNGDEMIPGSNDTDDGDEPDDNEMTAEQKWEAFHQAAAGLTELLEKEKAEESEEDLSGQIAAAKAAVLKWYAALTAEQTAALAPETAEMVAGLLAEQDPPGGDEDHAEDVVCMIPSKEEGGEAAGYSSLAEAIAAAGDGDTIQLAKNTAESITIDKDSRITLDLNGNTLTGFMNEEKTKMEDVVTNYGTLTILDSGNGGTILGGSANVLGNNSGIALVNEIGATCYVQSGTIKREDDNTAGNYVVKNKGTMYIRDGEISNNSSTSNLVANYNKDDDAGSFLHADWQAWMEISGGVLRQNLMSALKNDPGAYMHITGDAAVIERQDLTNPSAYACNLYGTVEMDGGSIKTNGIIPVFTWKEDGTEFPGLFTVTGGTLECTGLRSCNGVAKQFDDQYVTQSVIPTIIIGENANVTADKLETVQVISSALKLVPNGSTAEIRVASGTYKKDVSEYAADGYTAVKQDDDTWVVKKVPNVVRLVNNGTEYPSLHEAVSVANGLSDYNIIIELLDNITETACSRIVGKSVTIQGNGFTVTRGDTFAPIQDNARSTYHPAMIEVTDPTLSGKGFLRLENITLDDAAKTAGTKYSQASTDGKGGNGDLVQDAIIATYGDEIVLGEGAVVKGYGGMSAVRLSAGKLTMENGSKITGGKVFNTKGGGNGPAGAVWIQGGSLIMEEGSEITGVVGRAVYIDGGSAEINGIINDISANSNMWNNGGTAIHARNGATVTLNSKIGDEDGTKLPGNAIEVINENSTFTMTSGSSIQNVTQAIRVIGGTVNMEEGSLIQKGSRGIFIEGGTVQMDGTITQLVDDDGHVVQLSGGTLNIGATGYITQNRGGYGVVYLQRGTVDVYGHIDENYVNQRAGGIGGTNHSDECYVTLHEGATINNNITTETGGAIMMSRGTFTMDGGTISGNIAKDEGGGVFIREKGAFIMNKGSITDNTSGGYGGGVAYAQNYCYVELKGGTISGNKMLATVTTDIATLSATVTGGIENDLGLGVNSKDKAGSFGTIDRYLQIAPEVVADRNVYMTVDNKTVTVDDDTKLGNASSTNVAALKTAANGKGWSDPFATLWLQNENAVNVTVKFNQTNAFDPNLPVYVLNSTGSKSVQAKVQDGVISFSVPGSTEGVSVALAQPSEDYGTLTLVAEPTQLLDNDELKIKYTLTYNTSENMKNSGSTISGITLSEDGLRPISRLDENYTWEWTVTVPAFEANKNIEKLVTLNFKLGEKDIELPSNLVSTKMVNRAEYTVTFDSNGGSPVGSQALKNGDLVTKPDDPTRETYEFSGWTLEGEDYDFSKPVTQNITLVANWGNHVHRITDWTETTPATCTQRGSRTGTCPFCEQEVTEEIPMLPHQFSTVWSYNAANHWHVCSVCGEIDAMATHTYGGWYEVEPATTTSFGEEARDCTVCGRTQTRSTAMLDDEEEDQPTVIINTPPTPLASASGENGLVDIPDETVPLADSPKTGNQSALWYIVAVLSVVALAGVMVLEKKKNSNKN